MSAPVAFIAAQGVLTQASDSVESATTNSLQRAACVVPNARQKMTQNLEKQPVINYLRKRAHSTAKIAAKSQMRENPVKVPYICKINILVVASHSFALMRLIHSLCSFRRRSSFLALLNSAAPASYAQMMRRNPRNASPRRISQPPAHPTFHHRSMLLLCCPCYKILVLLLIT
jgi:hypothetical protein